MKQKTILLILATSACLLGTAGFAADTTSTTPRPARRHQGPPHSPEMEAYHKLVLSIYDTDQSGALDDTERSVLHDDIEAGTMQPPPRPPRGPGRMGPPPEIIAQYDTDKDGQLNDTERAALEADIASGKLPPPPPPGACPPSGDDTTTTSRSKTQF